MCESCAVAGPTASCRLHIVTPQYCFFPCQLGVFYNKICTPLVTGCHRVHSRTNRFDATASAYAKKNTHSAINTRSIFIDFSVRWRATNARLSLSMRKIETITAFASVFFFFLLFLCSVFSLCFGCDSLVRPMQCFNSGIFTILQFVV